MAILFLANQDDIATIGEGALAALAETYSAFLPFQEVNVEFSFVSKEEIRQVNQQYRNIDEATDVLSFPLYEPEDLVKLPAEKEPVLLGSIMICPEITIYSKESLLQVLHHGMLHLIGYDHEIDSAKWDGQEQAILNNLKSKGYEIQPLGYAEI